jgi:hypothetical protein
MTEVIADTYKDVVHIPSGVMDLVRQSYDSRERVLDWMLAIAVVGVLLYLMGPKFNLSFTKLVGVNADKIDLMPNQDVAAAVGTNQPVETIYTYNMPIARRNIAYNVGPTSVRKPFNPKFGPQYNADYEEYVTPAWKGDVRHGN